MCVYGGGLFIALIVVFVLLGIELTPTLILGEKNTFILLKGVDRLQFRYLLLLQDRTQGLLPSGPSECVTAKAFVSPS